MMDEEMVAVLVPLIVAVLAALLQKLRASDTNKHGDAFIDMLKDGADSLEKVADIFPQVKGAVTEYKEIVAEAEQIWESSSFTADDVRFIALKAKLYKDAIDAELDKLRRLRE